MRRGEILCIRKSHIDFNTSVLFIPSTKTDTPRSIPLSSAAITSLRGQLRASQSVSGGVIPLHERPLFTYSLRGLSGAFLRLCRRLNIDNLHFHDLRHEATSRLFEKGLNPVEVATITGHKDTRMLMRYTHSRAEDLVGRLGQVHQKPECCLCLFGALTVLLVKLPLSAESVTVGRNIITSP